jgi:signal transduction histidine kinase
LEQSYIQLNETRLRYNFIANISHELKTPLTIMGGYAQLTEWDILDGTINDDTFVHLHRISEESQRLAKLINRMLKVAVATEEQSAITGVDPNDLLEEVKILCEPMLLMKNNKLVVNLEESCPKMAANYGMVLQVLVNLINNSNRHSENGVLTVTVQYNAESVLFCVQDEGSGIPSEILERIFQRGISGVGSTGLGIPICREIIEAHGGEIKIESKLHSGTKVSFAVPLFRDYHQKDVI